MNLTLKGHDYKYAVEQIMLMMYPTESPLYPTQPEVALEPEVAPLSAVVSLTYDETEAIASTQLSANGNVYHGSAHVERDQLVNQLVTGRLLQKIIKLSFYKAAVQHTGVTPVWGALTGIRPGKIATAMLQSGHDDRSVLAALGQEYFVSPERAALCIGTAKASLQIKASLAPHDVALYIGIPFCPTRCHYCSFVSHSVEKSMKLIPPFLESLHREIQTLAEHVSRLGLRVVSVYIGGGTPTTLSAAQLDALLKKLSSSFDLSSVREYTVEAGRPDTITPEKLHVLSDNNVDRISINPQTMNDHVLSAIGRRHNAGDVVTAFEQARQAGFHVINMDLIAGLPCDTPATFDVSLDKILTLRPENITVHTLSLKKGTRITLERDQTPLPDGQAVASMLDTAGQKLRQAGYVPYYLYRQKYMSGGFENVGWCLPGSESLYNILIMEELTTILALGGGGVTKLVADGTGRIERIFNLKYPYEYIERIDDVLAGKARIDQFFLNTPSQAAPQTTASS